MSSETHDAGPSRRRRFRDQPEAALTVAAAPGAGALRGVLELSGDPVSLLAESTRSLAAMGVEPRIVEALRRPERARLDGALAWLRAAPDHDLVGWTDPEYPPLLREISDPPLCLFLRGEAGLLAAPQIAVVGSRNPSPGGRDNAREFARHLATCGLAITSGLALGVDGAAHAGALDAGAGTVAVLGTGPDEVYPREHAALAERIAARGALVSEFFPGTPPRRENFPRRNRIISGLALGVLVVEAGLRSGSLITARLAGEQGREIFAIPGSIHNPMARGCHLLIRQGAKLVESGADVLEELGPLGTSQAPAGVPAAPAEPEPLDEDYRRLLEACGHDPVTVETLIERSGLTAAEVSSMLLILELRGDLESGPGGRYTRVRKRS